MSAPTPKQIVDFLRALGALKDLPRVGWPLRGVRNAESVADHSYRVAVLAMVLADWIADNGTPLDAEKTMRMALLHDIAEAKTGDIPKPVSIRFPQGFKAKIEAEAAAALLSPMGALGGRYRELLDEYEQGGTLESAVVHAADKLETLLQAYEYEASGSRRLEDFWTNARELNDLNDLPAAQKLFEELVRRLEQLRSGTYENE
ncbi:MAG: HD family hydrolase [Candidatus Poribacteria bacterium]|nr:HD family hydrolase [Candidatus Poribacteria bacterium]